MTLEVDWEPPAEEPPEDSTLSKPGRGTHVLDGGPTLRTRLELITERGITHWVKLWTTTTLEAARSCAGDVRRKRRSNGKAKANTAFDVPGSFEARYARVDGFGVVWVKWTPPRDET